jgi:hypothetical protein
MNIISQTRRVERIGISNFVVSTQVHGTRRLKSGSAVKMMREARIQNQRHRD